VTCHNDRLRTAGLLLDGANLFDLASNADIWEKVVRKLRSRAMPPAGRPRPDDARVRDLIVWLETGLDRASTADPKPGRPVIHRLNRSEYGNAVRDLFGLEIDVRSLLPADDPDTHGFDNISEVLSISPTLLERYLLAARKVSSMAVGVAPQEPTSSVYGVPKTMEQNERLDNNLPLGSRGGIAISHYFPGDGDYRINIRLQRNLYDLVRGLGAPHTLELRVDGARVKRFTIGGEDHGETAPVGYGGTIDGSPEWERYARAADAGLEAGLSVRAGFHTLTVAFLTDLFLDDELPQPKQVGFGRDTNEMLDGLPAVDTVTITGPYNLPDIPQTPLARRAFVCWPQRPTEQDRCARAILSALARRAFRRSVTSQEVEPLFRLFRAREGRFETRLQFALQGLLVYPEFLFRIERNPVPSEAGQAVRVSDTALASRLSFFLWSSIPDAELLAAAEQGRLKNPVVLERQVRRMLSDGRSKALVDNFAGQWLVIRNIREVTPDPDLFPGFDDNLRRAFQQETELFIGSQIREDRSLLELLTANYSFLNERLAKHYAVSNVYGERFRRVTFSDKDHRGGLLGQGNILTVTSYPARTSPVLRGKWLLENILGTPPPEPPPNVPALQESGIREGLSVRARLEAHRKNPVCATCHAIMDPLGFALENFDAVGAWRTVDSGAAVDPSGLLPGGVTFEGPSGLRDVLVHTYREEFVRTVIEKLLTYALGRAVNYSDMPAVRNIAKASAAQDYRWSAIILNTIRSVPFQMSELPSAGSSVVRP
jgi:hypothetical protein